MPCNPALHSVVVRAVSGFTGMMEPILWTLWGLWMAQALLTALEVGGYARYRRWQESLWGHLLPADQQSAALIIAVKGFDPENTPHFFEAILAQDYPRYRVLITVESEKDPVVPWLRGMLAERERNLLAGNAGPGPFEVRIIIAGTCEGRGQKVHNQIEAFKELDAGDRMIAFADADIRCATDWLARLTAPLNAGTHQLASTYRWLVPKRPSLVNHFASVINASVATLGGRDLWSNLWGGSMAITRHDFDELDVPEVFHGSLNDDLRMGEYARTKGRKIAFIKSLLIPSPVDFTWSSFFEFGRRQYYQVRWYSPALYSFSLMLTGIYTLGFVSSLTAILCFHHSLAWIPLGVVLFADQLRARARSKVIVEHFGNHPEIVEALKKTMWVEHLGTPAAMAIHGMVALSALFVSRIRWAGIHYRILSQTKTEVLKREG